jgi:hypothetical protein
MRTKLPPFIHELSYPIPWLFVKERVVAFDEDNSASRRYGNGIGDRVAYGMIETWASEEQLWLVAACNWRMSEDLNVLQEGLGVEGERCAALAEGELGIAE